MLLCPRLLCNFRMKIKFSKSRKQNNCYLNCITWQSFSKIKDNMIRYVSFSKVAHPSFAASNERAGRSMSFCSGYKL